MNNTTETYRRFDWGQSVEQHTSDTVNHLWNTHHLVISEDEWIKQYLALSHDHRKRSRHMNEMGARRRYRKLKERFGFFTGEVDNHVSK